jgi:hypothetical protein
MRPRKQPEPPPPPEPKYHRYYQGDPTCAHPLLREGQLVYNQEGWGKICDARQILRPRLPPDLAEAAERARREHTEAG